jgi:nicotinate-nucleotide pyrophosphorylase
MLWRLNMNYLVRVAQKYESYASVEVEASTPEEAFKKAVEQNRILIFDGMKLVGFGADRILREG